MNAFSENNFHTKVKLFDKDRDIFEEYNVDKEIEKALDKIVWLDCGGYLVIEKQRLL